MNNVEFSLRVSKKKIDVRNRKKYANHIIPIAIAQSVQLLGYGR